MAIEVCSETPSAGISPRISFSHDLKNTEGAVPVENRHLGSDLCIFDSTGSDFVFCITNSITEQLSSADELFSNGKIVPMEVKRVSNAPREPLPHHRPRPRPRSSSTGGGFTEKKRLKEFLSAESDDAENEEEKPSSKYFWQFKRSSSLNFDTNRGNGLIRSLQFLSRSNSTGSAPTPKQTESQKQRLQKQCSVSSRRSSSSSSSSSSSTYYFYNSSQKPSLKKSNGSSANGVRISPVLNLPQSYIPKATARFFGIGSLFCNGKTKRKKK
ncbi:uncharacterized protein LOC107467263 [Arachis duranensis]|uniref:Uncharacterized protein LOC107467263 n=1 Tax=Arachis duranensis TaxID=130453 RepID=A0A6P4BGC4_ARADU|nr:uncharacterized protein LOC107467263 [Arachis duranensis]